MKVKELIQELSKLDPDLPVVVDGVLDLCDARFVVTREETKPVTYHTSVAHTWGPTAKRLPRGKHVLISQ
jgi:hypothetical protein